jgi:ribosome-binding protein aMBF1 (putative translation factor)
MKTIELDGTTYVLVPREAWEKLARGDVQMPELPPADEDGNRDAIAFARASIARTLIRDRVAAGLSQTELARHAGIARESLNRIEKAKVTPDEKTVARLEGAIKKAMTRRPVRHVPASRRKAPR